MLLGVKKTFPQSFSELISKNYFSRYKLSLLINHLTWQKMTGQGPDFQVKNKSLSVSIETKNQQFFTSEPKIYAQIKASQAF